MPRLPIRSILVRRLASLFIAFAAWGHDIYPQMRVAHHVLMLLFGVQATERHP